MNRTALPLVHPFFRSGPLRELKQPTASFSKTRRLPDWWLPFVESHPFVPNTIAVAGLVFIMFMLAPTIVHPSEKGVMIDSFSTVTRSVRMVHQADAVRTAYHNSVSPEVRDYARAIFFSPVLYFVVPFFMLLEYLFPFNPAQPLMGKGFLQDAIWFVAGAPTRILVLGVADDFLRDFYNHHLSFMTISSAVVWPGLLQITAALLVFEFMAWFSHLIRHKVLTFWFFHAVHHSQRELNVFTDDRSHFVDRIVASLVMFLPFYAFQVPSLYAVAVIGLYIAIHSRFVHTNVRLNLGWLGWLIVSPQFHRVHHSVDPLHYDKNYAAVISVFDYAFGTAYPSRDVYPETGIDDIRFPIENNSAVSGLPGNWIRQFAFPFVQSFKHIASRLSVRKNQPNS